MPEPKLATPTIDYGSLRAVLVGCVRRAAPSWLNDQIEDIAQGALERMATKLDGRETSYPTAYLMKVANHAVIDEIRRVTRRREVPLDVVVPEDRMYSAELPDARAIAIGAGISDCLTHLNDDRRRAVGLYLLGHNVPESAGILGWSRKRVENLVYRGLAALRDCLRTKELTP